LMKRQSLLSNKRSRCIGEHKDDVKLSKKYNEKARKGC
jgi:hypothetical protein